MKFHVVVEMEGIEKYSHKLRSIEGESCTIKLDNKAIAKVQSKGERIGRALHQKVYQ